MNVIITGVAGFIGSHLANKLIDRGHQVYGIDNLSTGKAKNIDARMEYFVADTIENIGRVNELFELVKPEVVVHCAASYKDPEDWYRDSATNVLGTVNIIKAAKNNKVKRIIYMQTSLCYGWPEIVPIPVVHKIAPTNSYSISKTAAERYIAMSGIDYVSFRLANCYGERNLSGPVPTFFKRLTEGEDCTVVTGVERDFVYINDLLFYLLQAILKSNGHGAYHVSSGRSYKIVDLYNAMCKSLNIEKDPIFKERGDDDIPYLILENDLTIKEFGQPVLGFTPLQSGIDRATDWYKNNPVTETYTHLKNLK
ncbi:NAD-dependent epimerase/dehydratase family protein [Candidatus Pacearchaeota archaeon]|nr:NAD-dependent epimerase/dehydratase family protein [Candidatus Pacearchaeota archaeon]